MNNIITGIYARYNADATLKAALPGGLFFEKAKQGASYTYATFNVIVSTVEYWLGTTYFELPRIQFDIYAETNALRKTAYEALVALYDDSKPTATGYNTIIMERESEQMVRDGEQDEIFRAVVDYRCRYQKN